MSDQKMARRARKLPEFRGYTVDERLKEFRRVSFNGVSQTMVTVLFESPRGQNLLRAYKKNKYIKHGYAHCPFCGSEDIEGGFVQAEANEAWQKCDCNACGKAWTDIYKLVDFEERE